MEFGDLSQEVLEKARACATHEELIALAESEGIDLSLEQLEGLSGSGIPWDSGSSCDKCSGKHWIVS